MIKLYLSVSLENMDEIVLFHLSIDASEDMENMPPHPPLTEKIGRGFAGVMGQQFHGPIHGY